MILILLGFSIIAAGQGATLIPVHSSQVDVRRSGDQYSYNIQETKGIRAIETAPYAAIDIPLGLKPLEGQPVPVPILSENPVQGKIFQGKESSGLIMSKEPIKELQQSDKVVIAPIQAPLGVQSISKSFAEPIRDSGKNKEKKQPQEVTRDEIPDGTPIFSAPPVEGAAAPPSALTLIHFPQQKRLLCNYNVMVYGVFYEQVCWPNPYIF